MQFLVTLYSAIVKRHLVLDEKDRHEMFVTFKAERGTKSAASHTSISASHAQFTHR
jgi:hypothetical protein